MDKLIFLSHRLSSRGGFVVDYCQTCTELVARRAATPIIWDPVDLRSPIIHRELGSPNSQSLIRLIESRCHCWRCLMLTKVAIKLITWKSDASVVSFSEMAHDVSERCWNFPNWIPEAWLKTEKIYWVANWLLDVGLSQKKAPKWQEGKWL